MLDILMHARGIYEEEKEEAAIVRLHSTPLCSTLISFSLMQVEVAISSRAVANGRPGVAAHAHPNGTQSAKKQIIVNNIV